MTLLLRALILGYGSAFLAGLWVDLSGLGLWPAVLAAWIGGGVISLALAWIGAVLWPEVPANDWSAAGMEDEFRRWDEDLADERLATELRDGCDDRRRPLDRAG